MEYWLQNKTKIAYKIAHNHMQQPTTNQPTKSNRSRKCFTIKLYLLSTFDNKPYIFLSQSLTLWMAYRNANAKAAAQIYVHDENRLKVQSIITTPLHFSAFQIHFG